MENLDFKFDYKIPDLSSDDKKLYFNNSHINCYDLVSTVFL